MRTRITAREASTLEEDLQQGTDLGIHVTTKGQSWAQVCFDIDSAWEARALTYTFARMQWSRAYTKRLVAEYLKWKSSL